MRENSVFIVSFCIIIPILIFLIYSELAKSKPVVIAPAVHENAFKSTDGIKSEIRNTSPFDTASTCMTWYMVGFMAGGDYTNLPELSQSVECFTPDFISNLDSISSNLGADPILLVQNSGESWHAPLDTKLLEEKQNYAEAEVVIGSGDEETHYRIKLYMIQNKWLIGAITNK